MTRLSELIGPECDLTGDVDAQTIDIQALELDSREIGPGHLFAAMPGTAFDGARFIPAAIDAGAAAILCARSADVQPTHVPIIRADDPRRAIAMMASRFYPRQPETIVAVTGTSGKSSVADFVRQIFSTLGHRAASVGTIGIVRPDGSVYGGLTTPDPITLHRTLQELADEGVTHLAFEASSHGLDQRRLDGVRIKAAAFTNLGRDHLDYHPTVQAYLDAKLRLFDVLLPEAGTGVVFLGDDGAQPGGPEQPPADKVVEVLKTRGIQTLTVGTNSACDLPYETMGPSPIPQRLTFTTPDLATVEVALPLLGSYQAENATVAVALAIAVGAPPTEALVTLNTLTGVSGRLELIGTANGAPVLVDYAHKPDALETVLKNLRQSTSGRLISVFGCGGDRDKGKRPMMGEISTRLADITIVTDDNPRSEDPAAVRRDILDAAPGAKEIGDRAEAIRDAVAMAAPGDVVVIAGKGHETGQIVGDEVRPFSDQDVARAAIAEFDRND